MERRGGVCSSGLLSCCDVGNLLCAHQAFAGSSGMLKVRVAPTQAGVLLVVVGRFLPGWGGLSIPL